MFRVTAPVSLAKELHSRSALGFSGQSHREGSEPSEHKGLTCSGHFFNK